MKIIKERLLTGVEKYVDSITCNSCGKTINTELEDWQSFQWSWGYYSKRDDTLEQFDMCEDCCDKLRKSLVIKPTENDRQF